jgi:hypothetical protein
MSDQDKSPMERFNALLGKIVGVTKKELNEEIEAEQRVAEEIIEVIEGPFQGERAPDSFRSDRDT